MDEKEKQLQLARDISDYIFKVYSKELDIQALKFVDQFVSTYNILSTVSKVIGKKVIYEHDLAVFETGFLTHLLVRDILEIINKHNAIPRDSQRHTSARGEKE